jgi:protein-disulfide isomerase
MTQRDCPICDDDFDTDRGVRMHAWDSHEACHFCGTSFTEKESLYRHWLDEHSGELADAARKRSERAVGDRTVCPVCDERMESDDALRRHTWNVHGACHFCGRGFEDRSELQIHWLVAHSAHLADEDRQQAVEAVGQPDVRDRLVHGGPVAALTGVDLSRRAMMTGGGIGIAALVGFGIATSQSSGGESGTSNSIQGHPAARDVSNQPVRGPTTDEAPGTIVAFEDPFCPACRQFELRSFPQLLRDYIETGDVSFVFRGVPLIREYSDIGVHAMEATDAQSADAFWQLKKHYYEKQPQINASNVEAKTEEFLGTVDEVDAVTVMKAIDERRYDPAVQADLAAARAAGVRGTPTFFLFRDGSFVAKLVGPQSASTLANALGL